MLTRFVMPDLVRLDELDSEVLAVGVFADQRPARGVAGLCDFRLRGVLSRLMAQGFVSGKAGEVVMIPGKPLLSYDKLLFVGLGGWEELQRPVLEQFVRDVLTRLIGLRVRSAVVELPGRSDNRLSASLAAEVLLGQAAQHEELDSLTLIESAEGRGEIEAYIAEHRRRVRRVI